VAFVCDTPDDVNAVIQLDVEAQYEFYQLIAKAEARVQALASSSRNSQFGRVFNHSNNDGFLNV
ncbi:hypothetical protein ACC754_43700, partial [Rhizobium johnstonii]